MKKTSDRNKRETVRDTMRKEYRFDYRRAKPNRFAEKMPQEVVAVVLDPDVARTFQVVGSCQRPLALRNRCDA